MYIPELSNYSYSTRQAEEQFSVGWLSEDHEFTTGHVNPMVVSRLKELPIVNKYRGFHICPYCEDKPAMGNGEIHVIDADGRKFVAPTMIIHYIEAHNYKPPNIFLQAVMGEPTEDVDVENEVKEAMARTMAERVDSAICGRSNKY